MKSKILIMVGLLFSFLAVQAQREYEDDYNNDYRYDFKSNSIRISPAEFGRAEFQINYERYFKNRSSSITISPSVFLKENREQTIEGWQVMGQYRFYLSHLNKANQRNFLGMENYGFYAGIYGLYMDYTEDFLQFYWDDETQTQYSETFRKEVTAIEGGALIGVEVDITKRIQVDFFVGGGIRYSDYTNTYEDLMPDDVYYYDNVFDPEYQGVKPKVGLSLGVSF